jgi:uncharacterized protein
MADFFFDTSPLVKRHVTEVGSAWVKSLVRAKAGHTLYLARITAVEVAAAITRRQSMGDLTLAQAGAILGHFRRHLTQRYRVIELTPALFNDAMAMARKHQLRAYDVVQLAVAIEAQRLQQDAGLGAVSLVSADRDLNTAATAEGLIVDDPRSHPFEEAVAQLRHQLASRPTAMDWLNQVVGSISDEAAFAEALEYGRAFRQADRPPDDDAGEHAA